MTETTQPDPRKDALRCVQCEFRADDSPGGWYDLSEHRTATGHRYENVRPTRKPLTVADIPAGQGATSLFLGPFLPDLGAVYFKAHDGRLARVIEQPAIRTEQRALWDHLAATLPTITEAQP